MGFLKFLLKKLHFHRIGNISPCDTWWLSHSNLWRALYQPMHQLARACRHRCGSALLSGFGNLKIAPLSENLKMFYLDKERWKCCNNLEIFVKYFSWSRKSSQQWERVGACCDATIIGHMAPIFGFGSCSQCFGKWTPEFCTFYIIHQSSETLVYCH